MCKKHYRYYFISISFSLIVSGCVSSSSESNFRNLAVENGLPQSKLDYYSDSFNQLREDVWEKCAVAWKPKQEEKFKMADISIEKEQLKIETPTGFFSNGSLATKYLIRGDFDIQMDCRFDFLRGAFNMDQFLIFSVYDNKMQWGAHNSYGITLVKRGDQRSGRIGSVYREKGKIRSASRIEINDFNGKLRLVRMGNKISTYYKKVEMTKWKRMATLKSTKKDLSVILSLSNYTAGRGSITAKTSIAAWFDNYKINAAQNILEDDI